MTLTYCCLWYEQAHTLQLWHYFVQSTVRYRLACTKESARIEVTLTYCCLWYGQAHTLRLRYYLRHSNVRYRLACTQRYVFQQKNPSKPLVFKDFFVLFCCFFLHIIVLYNLVNNEVKYRVTIWFLKEV